MALGFFHALYALHGTICLAHTHSGWTNFSPGLAVDEEHFSAHFLWVIFPFMHLLGGTGTVPARKQRNVQALCLQAVCSP